MKTKVQEVKENIIEEFEKEFCNNHKKPIR
jgi:hypothetical protein